MNCINCSKEATLTFKTGQIEFYICEFCKEKFSVKKSGKASANELNRVQRRQLQGFLDHRKGIEPLRKTIARMKRTRSYSGKMYDPDRDRNVNGAGDIRART